MCFRPAEVSLKKCPACGKQNKPVAKTCEQCGVELHNVVKDFDADQAKLDAVVRVPGAPGAPPAPGAPSVPKPPSVG